jgi:medium-chain acyl-[acyl-carrier-protein] hydrolase
VDEERVEHCIVRFATPPGTPRVRLVCLPHAGGGASTFFAWSRALAPDIEVCAAVAPGRDHRRHEPPLTTVPMLAQQVVDGILDQVDTPVALFGHSAGAAAAYEVARQLQARGRVPVHLFVAARRAPHLRPGLPPMSGLDDAALVAAVGARYGAIPPEVVAQPELLALFVPVIRADLRLHEEYWSPPLPLACPITVFGGTDDGAVSLEELDAWASQTHGTFRRRMFAGGHFFVREHRAAVLAAIAAALLPDASSRTASPSGEAVSRA